MEQKSLSEVVEQIDQIVRQGLWFDFHVLTYDGHTLTIAGSQDLIYYHKLEIRFEGVFFVSAFFGGWHSDTREQVFSMPEDSAKFNGQFEIQSGYTLFRFKTDDFRNDVWVAAESISYNCDTVFYYQRDDLKPNERIFKRPSSSDA